MNEIIDAIKARRSTKSFKSDPVSKEIVDRVIEAGLYAASAQGKQVPVIVAVTNKKLRDRLSEMNRKVGGWDEGFDPFYGAPVVLVVLADKNWANRVYDGSLVIGNMMLAAHSLKIGSCWIHRAKEEFESDEGKAILKELGISGDFEGIGHCVLGVSAAEREMPPRRAGRVFYAE
ncbi:nitroreductase [Treponema socranskii]|uniref:nitroreductase n=1 Tax=Treponema socranskii TaxID=53419 RepID=UPI0028720C66|nr:nitroreductase [Treponema socranskii]MDR9859682.1 nitroreductase [Treponema socranskii]